MSEQERKRIALEIWAYADSLEPDTLYQDVYEGLCQLGRDVLNGVFS